MTAEPNSSYKYKVGGSLPVNSPTYAQRQADQKLCEELRNGEFCYVLTPRQMGKSSLMVQTMHELEVDGFACTAIYISGLGSTDTTEAQWYAGIVSTLTQDFHLGSKINVKEWLRQHEYLSPVKRLSEFIEKVLLVNETRSIVIFLDEIDNVRSLKFRIDDFFGFIRNCYEKRANNQAYNRLNFAMFGVATPSELVQDKTNSPFNIGKAIELDGFNDVEARPLAGGLQGKVSTVRAERVALKEVLDWTGGQPFLTQKICKLIQDLSSPIPAGSEKQEIEKLIKSHIIENWQEQDSPEHLQTISKRILGREQHTLRLLELYKQILRQGEVTADNSPEEIELRLSGLVVKQQGKLKVTNKIYQSIFNKVWVNEEIGNIEKVFPYPDKSAAWLKTHDSSHLLRGEELSKALRWANLYSKNVTNQIQQFLNASTQGEEAQGPPGKQVTKTDRQPRRQNNTRSIPIPTPTKKQVDFILSGIIGVITALIFWWILQQRGELPPPNAKAKPTPNVASPAVSEEQQWLSYGERRLFREKGNPILDEGAEHFKSGDYNKAIESFENAVKLAPNEPEPQIYLNNVKARQQGKPFTLAVVVPVDNNATSAQEMLRGVADAQTKFNDSNGLNNRLLEVVIANDGNAPRNATKISKKLVADRQILGVIGHNSSDASDAALQEYEAAELAMVSPTSTSTSLESKVFFRTVPSDTSTGKKLAEYARSTLGLDNVAIFSNSKSRYSTSLQQVFAEAFVGSVQIIDIKNDNLEVLENKVSEIATQNQVSAAVLLPSTDTIQNAIWVARANAKQPPEKRLKLLGGDALYNPNTLIDGGEAVEGLVLAVPWIDKDNDYTKEANKRWQGSVNWRTAASYDATRALIEAIKKVGSNASREAVLRELRNVKLSEKETSGYPLKFTETGDRTGEAFLVKVVKADKDAPAPEGSQFSFKLIIE